MTVYSPIEVAYCSVVGESIFSRDYLHLFIVNIISFLLFNHRLEEMRRSMKRPYEEELWDEPKRSRISNSSNPSRFELSFQNTSR